MTCKCPKCSTEIEVDADEVPEAGTPAKCSGCKTRLQVSREQFVRRAYRKADDITCAHCGGRLSSYINCAACGRLYPEYLVAETPDAIRKRRRASSTSRWNIKNISFEWQSASASAQDYPAGAAAHTPSSAGSTKGISPLLVKVAVLLVLIGALGGGYLFYQDYRAKQQFASHFVRSIYVLKTGADLNGKICARIAGDMMQANTAGARVTADETAKLAKIRKEVEKISEVMGNPPGSFAGAHDKLGKLKEAYRGMEAATTAPPNSAASFTEAASRAEANFKKAATDLQTGLPPELNNSLARAKSTHRELSNL